MMDEADRSNRGLWIGLGVGCVVFLGFGCIVALAGFFFLGGIAVPLGATSFPPADGFIPAVWAEGPSEENEFRSPRCGMTNALETEILYFGMPRTDVEATLGQPDSVLEDGAIYTYDLGHCILDYDVYTIEFDESDTVIDYKYVQG